MAGLSFARHDAAIFGSECNPLSRSNYNKALGLCVPLFSVLAKVPGFCR